MLFRAVNTLRTVAPRARSTLTQQSRTLVFLNGPENPWRISARAAAPQLSESSLQAIKSAEAGDWKSLNAEQKELCYRLSYGKTMQENSAGFGYTSEEKFWIFRTVILVMCFSFGVFTGVQQIYRKEMPITLTKEWKDQEKQYRREANINPIKRFENSDAY